MGNQRRDHGHPDRSLYFADIWATAARQNTVMCEPLRDTRPLYEWDSPATPDLAAIDAHVQRADFVLVTHTHYDHVLDVPQIALKTHATVIGTESTENVLRAYKVPEEQLITVRGGEDYEFGAFFSQGDSEPAQPSGPASTISAQKKLLKA